MLSKPVHDLFEELDDEFLEFERIPETERLSQRMDLHAFLLLDRLVPGMRDMVSGARHDVIYLDTDVEELAAVATDEDIRSLVRCGVRYEDGGLEMFA
jgi:hypothetical protein